MKISKYIILSLGLFLGFSASSMAMGIPEVYISGAFAKSKSKMDVETESNLDSIKKNFDTNSYLLSLGIRPLNVPVFGNFRVEAQYLGALSGDANKDNQYALVVYYDILRIIPFINPYIGVGAKYASYKFNSIEDLKQKNKSLYTFHAGLVGETPIAPLGFFVEYRYSNTMNSNTFKMNSSDVMLGLRYYILK
ncbi:MAG: hypothetical protein LBH40_06500 [Alphaproteobacteria bacterium]|jgi:opacity protein-like surface antigen|nr:hypothetical protein [Alphaproteobacteria bacterium]